MDNKIDKTSNEHLNIKNQSEYLKLLKELAISIDDLNEIDKFREKQTNDKSK